MHGPQTVFQRQLPPRVHTTRKNPFAVGDAKFRRQYVYMVSEGSVRQKIELLRPHIESQTMRSNALTVEEKVCVTLRPLGSGAKFNLGALT